MTADLELLGTPEWPVAALTGEVDLANAEALARRVEAAVPNSAAGLVLDLTGVVHLDSSGLRIVFRLARRLGDRQQRLRLVVPVGSPLRRVLDLAGVATVAEVLATAPETGGDPVP